MDNNNYLVVCPTKKRAVALFDRLLYYLLWENIRCRVLKNIYVVDILGHEIVIRFISEGEYYEKSTGFRGWVVTEAQVEEWLDVAWEDDD